MRKIKLTRANKSILLKALAPYYYREKALGHNTEKTGRLILKIDFLPADRRASFSAEEIHLMRTTVNQLRNEKLAKGQYTDATDDMLLKLKKGEPLRKKRFAFSLVSCKTFYYFQRAWSHTSACSFSMPEHSVGNDNNLQFFAYSLSKTDVSS